MNTNYKTMYLQFNKTAEFFIFQYFHLYFFTFKLKEHFSISHMIFSFQMLLQGINIRDVTEKSVTSLPYFSRCRASSSQVPCLHLDG